MSLSFEKKCLLSTGRKNNLQMWIRPTTGHICEGQKDNQTCSVVQPSTFMFIWRIRWERTIDVETDTGIWETWCHLPEDEGFFSRIWQSYPAVTVKSSLCKADVSAWLAYLHFKYVLYPSHYEEDIRMKNEGLYSW